MKKTLTIASAVALLALGGCASVERDTEGLQAKIDEAMSPDFGECIYHAHHAVVAADQAQTVHDTVKAGKYWTASGHYMQTGFDAAAKAAEHRQKSEAACNRIWQPYWDAIAANAAAIEDLDARVDYLESLHEILRGVTFEFNSDRLTASAKSVLDVVANALQRRPVPVTIEGHTDNIGSAEYNMELSLRRAESVKAYLAARGVDPSLMTTT